MAKYITYAKGTERTQVSAGFCWGGFFFSGLWALFMGLWGQVLFVIAFLVFQQAVYTMATSVQDLEMMNSVFILGAIVVHIVFGLYGNTWYGMKLERQGYMPILELTDDE